LVRRGRPDRVTLSELKEGLRKHYTREALVVEFPLALGDLVRSSA
jgi:hypothetical protein